MNVSAIILAAGLSKRMNQNKLKMKIHNKYIYEYIFDTIKTCNGCFSEVIVVAKESDILERALDLGFKAVKNEMSYLGQSTSIKLGIQNSGRTCGHMFFVADQPYIKEDTVKELLITFEKNPNKIVMACYNGINGNPVIFPIMFKNNLLKLVGDTGGRKIIQENIDKLIKVHVQSDNEYVDIDTMEDYEMLLKKKVID